MSKRPASILIVGPLLIGMALLEPFATSNPRHSPPPPRVTAAADPDLAEYRTAAEAVRSKDFAAAREAISTLTTGHTPEARDARTVVGLYAWACGELQTARALLADRDPVRGRLEDWRLFALAESAAGLDDPGTAHAALHKLLTDYPVSPLRQQAVVRAAEIATARGDTYHALELVGAARDLELRPDLRLRLERVAWEIATGLGSRPFLESTARVLLVEFPQAADELRAIEVFAPPESTVDWHQVLTAAELERRARRLVDLDLLEPALRMLRAVDPAERGFDWRLLRAEALTRDGQGSEALATLETARPQTPSEHARLEWLRAAAALDASKARRGRANLPADRRQEMAAAARAHLRQVARIDADRELSLRALRRLFTEFGDERPFEERIGILRELRRLDPRDTTGARHLWRLGWKEYDERNYTGAIGYWRELGELYSGTSFARAGLYWSGRAHETLGNRTRARTLFEEVSSVSFTDFYRRHALERLGAPLLAAAGQEDSAPQPWPEDPLLGRAMWLTSIGLDEPAAIELGELRPRAEADAASALEALILARLGRRRDSIVSLWRAFPNLGSPSQSSVPETALRLYYPFDFRASVERYADHNGLPVHLVLAMIRQESAFDPQARSWAGARGLMQVMPTTGRELAHRMGLRYSTDRLSEPDFSIRLGTAYFRQVLSIFDEDELLALAGYNAGPYRIKRLWQRAGPNREIDIFLEGLDLEETKTYVKRVLLFADSYRKLYGQSG